MNQIKSYYNEHPLKTILFVAGITLLLASFFSEGYGMHDDHFLIIETASSWADGFDYNDWLPWNQKDGHGPKGHSLTYPGIIFGIFKFLQFIGIDDPKIQMIFIRLFQGALWLIAISTSFKISAKITNIKVAKQVAWLLTLGALIPFLAVRNLVEMSCIPFLLLGIWNVLKSNKGWQFLLAGIWLGIAFSLRFQLALFISVFGILMLFKFKFKHVLLTLLGLIISIGITQGLIDYIIWKEPFAEFIAYAEYNNSDHKYDYVRDMNKTGWYNYILILANISVPVIGFFYWFGIIINWKKLFLLVLPLIAFVIFHSYYPNRQERFIFPMIPIFLITGISGWEMFREKSKFWMNRPKLWNKLSKPFWILSIFIGIVSIFISAKQSRVDSMYFLYGKQLETTIVKESTTSDSPMSPMHYSQIWETSQTTLTVQELESLCKSQPKYNPIYIFSFGEENFNQRFLKIKGIFPKAKVEEVFEPSWYDRLLHWMNPGGNKNEVIRVIKTK